MKRIIFTLLFFSCLIISSFFVSCSKNEDPIDNSQQKLSNSTSNKTPINARIQGTGCFINGITGISTTATPGNTVVYTYSNTLGIPPNIVWTVSNVVPAGSVVSTTSSGLSTSLIFATNFASCTLTATGSGSVSPNNYDCNTYLNISAPIGGGTGGVTCSINGITSINACVGSPVVYTYSNSGVGFQNVNWTVTNVVPAGSVTPLSGSGLNVALSFAANFRSARLVATGTGGGNQCGAYLDLTLAAPSCSARINNIWCSPASSGYNAEINVDVFVGNPFCHQASVLIQWDPANFSGFLVAGGQYTLGANATALLPSQFDINANTSLPAGFYVPMIVKYTDQVTGQTCTVSLNPLVTGGCNRAPM